MSVCVLVLCPLSPAQQFETYIQVALGRHRLFKNKRPEQPLINHIVCDKRLPKYVLSRHRNARIPRRIVSFNLNTHDACRIASGEKKEIFTNSVWWSIPLYVASSVVRRILYQEPKKFERT